MKPTQNPEEFTVEKSKKPISSKSVYFPSSPIDEIARMGSDCGAINLALGAPDLPIPVEIREAAIRAMHGDHHQYTESWGARPLRLAIAEKTLQHLGVAIDPEAEVTVTCGITEGMLNLMMVVADAGDEIVLFEPFYDCYVPVIRARGAVPRYVRLHRPDWRFDAQELRATFNDQTKAIILNTPNNPTGKVFTHEELRIVADLCQEWDVLCVCDEIYEHMVFDGWEHRSMLQLNDMRKRTVVLSGVSKTYNLTGWRIAYIIAPQEITQLVRSVHEYVTYCAPAPLQAAAVAAFGMPADYYQDVSFDLQRRRDWLMYVLQSTGFMCYKPHGAFYVMADISNFGFKDDLDFARYLIMDVGVASVPGSSFYAKRIDGSDLVRFCFGKADSTLSAAEQRLAKLVKA